MLMLMCLNDLLLLLYIVFQLTAKKTYLFSLHFLSLFKKKKVKKFKGRGVNAAKKIKNLCPEVRSGKLKDLQKYMQIICAVRMMYSENPLKCLRNLTLNPHSLIHARKYTVDRTFRHKLATLNTKTSECRCETK